MAMEELSQPEKVLKQLGMNDSMGVFVLPTAKWTEAALSSPLAASSCPAAAHSYD